MNDSAKRIAILEKENAELKRQLEERHNDDPIKEELLKAIRNEEFRFLKKLEPIFKMELHISFFSDGNISREGYRIRLGIPYMNNIGEGFRPL